MWSLAQLESLLVTYGYLLLLPVAVVEGPIVTVLAGALAAAGLLDAWVVLPIVIVGDLIGDIICYAVGRWGSPRLLSFGGRFFGLTPDRMALIGAQFAKRGRKTLLVGKWTHSIGGLVLIAAGAARMAFAEFLLVNLAATLPKSLLLLLVGYYLGQNLSQWDGAFSSLPVLFLLIGLLLIYLLYVGPRRRRADP